MSGRAALQRRKQEWLQGWRAYRARTSKEALCKRGKLSVACPRTADASSRQTVTSNILHTRYCTLAPSLSVGRGPAVKRVSRGRTDGGTPTRRHLHAACPPGLSGASAFAALNGRQPWSVV